MVSAMNVNTSRRRFFWAMADETIALIERCCGKPSRKLSDLNELADAEFAALIPIIVDNAEFLIKDGQIAVRIQTGAPPIALCVVGSRLEEVLRSINGIANIQELAKRIAVLRNEPEAEIFMEVRQMVLTLITNGVCMPGNLPGSP